jgi:hypothetical protein
VVDSQGNTVRSNLKGTREGTVTNRITFGTVRSLYFLGWKCGVGSTRSHLVWHSNVLRVLPKPHCFCPHTLTMSPHVPPCEDRVHTR